MFDVEVCSGVSWKWICLLLRMYVTASRYLYSFCVDVLVLSTCTMIWTLGFVRCSALIRSREWWHFWFDHQVVTWRKVRRYALCVRLALCHEWAGRCGPLFVLLPYFLEIGLVSGGIIIHCPLMRRHQSMYGAVIKVRINLAVDCVCDHLSVRGVFVVSPCSAFVTASEALALTEWWYSLRFFGTYSTEIT